MPSHGTTLTSEFMTRWHDLVPKLSTLAKEYRKQQQDLIKQNQNSLLPKNNKKLQIEVSSEGGPLVEVHKNEDANNSNEEGEDEEEEDEDDELQIVEQEGCPDDTDFNKWSHHSSVATCDDEVLKIAMADDNTVSISI